LFDVDRTLLRRSSTHALAGSFRSAGIIGRRHLVRAAFWELVFVARGLSAGTIERRAERAMLLLEGFPVEELRRLVADALEPVLKPLLFSEPLALAERHRARGERVYVVTGALQEVADALAADLGLDGALGSRCEIVDGLYTGRTLAGLYGAGKATAVRELASREGFDLTASTAYSDSAADLPFLEAVGRPVAVNPDRRLRRIAGERAWPVLEFRELAHPRAA
jgi:HAD superfamily hydrolase (TIGR01490 family)